ncbi:hypothetical protein C5F59_034375 [Streptomyces sp. QL37]|uniref:hypothetical protein n=1 Tax=Streptomyces sp. QL37 TaxID=2093747 RepID=UPI000CF296E4|nr:hypothetical protein [Streptomyces sp. QL37]PPQ61290.1 hypothetical protein C5F59_34880 [Streptomyces sp. QL37]
MIHGALLVHPAAGRRMIRSLRGPVRPSAAFSPDGGSLLTPPWTRNFVAVSHLESMLSEYTAARESRRTQP